MSLFVNMQVVPAAEAKLWLLCRLNVVLEAESTIATSIFYL
jgi:hypothetical protein